MGEQQVREAPHAYSPTSAEVVARLKAARARRPEWVKVQEVARTEEGRPVHAVTVTDPEVSDRDKQHVLMTAGHHGNEESGRLIALTLLDWLLSSAAAEIRRTQRIVILPNMCPDSAECDGYIPDPKANVMRDHGRGKPVTAAGAAFERLAEALQPEVYVDMHSRGFAGCSYDMVLWSEPHPYLEDDMLLHTVAGEMGRAGERAGLLNVVHPLSWPGFMGESPDVSSANAFCYRRYKSLSFLTETSESNEYSAPARLRARSGLARLRALLAWGTRRHPKLPYAGYPCYLMGMFAKGLVAVGETAAARRRSRVELWRHHGGFARFDSEIPQRPEEAVLHLQYKGPELTQGVGFQIGVSGRREIVSVSLGGKRLRPAPMNGYTTWQVPGSTFVVVALKGLLRGKYELRIAHR